MPDDLEPLSLARPAACSSCGRATTRYDPILRAAYCNRDHPFALVDGAGAVMIGPPPRYAPDELVERRRSSARGPRRR